MIDWNRNGKHDLQDTYLEYMIYQEVMDDKEEDTSVYSRKSKSSGAPHSSGGIKLSGEEIHGGMLIMGLVMVIIAFVFYYYGVTCESTVAEFFYIFLGLASSFSGKWFLTGKNIIKKEYQKNHGIDREQSNEEKLPVGWIIAIILILIALFTLRSGGSSPKNSEPDDEYFRSFPVTTHTTYRTTTASRRTASAAATTAPKRTTTKKTTTKYDEFNVYDYYDAEDFYEDNYDDFWDYEDAEDYYNDAWGY